jgi:hypothetical protein
MLAFICEYSLLCLVHTQKYSYNLWFYQFAQIFTKETWNEMTGLIVPTIIHKIDTQRSCGNSSHANETCLTVNRRVKCSIMEFSAIYVRKTADRILSHKILQHPDFSLKAITQSPRKMKNVYQIMCKGQVNHFYFVNISSKIAKKKKILKFS